MKAASNTARPTDTTFEPMTFDRSCKSCGRTVLPMTPTCPACGEPYRGVFFSFGARVNLRGRPGKVIADIHHEEDGEATGEIELIQHELPAERENRPETAADPSADQSDGRAADHVAAPERGLRVDRIRGRRLLEVVVPLAGREPCDPEEREEADDADQDAVVRRLAAVPHDAAQQKPRPSTSPPPPNR